MSRKGIRRDPRLRWFLALLAVVAFGATLMSQEAHEAAALPDFKYPIVLASTNDSTCLITEGSGWPTHLSCWGANNFGQLGNGQSNPGQPFSTNWYGYFESLGSGSNHFCIQDSGTSILCWGKNESGQTGRDPLITGEDCSGTPCRTSPFEDGFGLPVCSVSDCSVWIGGPAGAPIDGGDAFTCSYYYTGEVKCWGDNSFGQLGDGTTNSRFWAASPAVIGMSGTEAVSFVGRQPLAAGGRHACVVVTGDLVYCWGDNGRGQLGVGLSDGSTSTPAPVCNALGQPGDCYPSEYLSGVQDIAAGDAHTCARLMDGTVWCWGSNQYGQLGSSASDNCGGITCSTFPQQVPGLTNVTRITAGAFHTCAITTNGAMRCWGRNQLGQLGIGSETDAASHTAVNGMSLNTQQASAGLNHTCAIDGVRAVRCWGDGRNFILSNAPTANCLFGGGTACATTPQIINVEVDGRPSIAAIGPNAGRVTGTDFTLDIYGSFFSPASRVKFNFVQLAPPTFIDAGHLSVTVPAGLIASFSPATVRVINPGFEGFDTESNPRFFDYFNPIAVGATHSCRVTPAGAVECWGDNTYGQLGRGSVGGTSNVATVVTGLSSGVAHVVVGDDFSCALMADGSVSCWGHNDRGQLGTSSEDCLVPVPVGLCSPVPSPSSFFTNNATQIAAGGQHACAVVQSGEVYCWGRGTEGQLGDNSNSDSVSPGGIIAQSEGGVVGVDKLALGKLHSCFIGYTYHELWCTGDNTYGQFGNGDTTSTNVFVRAGSFDWDFRTVSAGEGFTCTVQDYWGVRCFGRNDQGQLGYTSLDDCSGTPCTLVPAQVQGLPPGLIAQVAAGGSHTCAVDATLQTYCWGSDEYGQIGDGPPSGAAAVPVSAPTGLTAVQGISAGVSSTCAAQLDGVVKCWGNNMLGQVGATTTETCTAQPCATVPVVLGSVPPIITNLVPNTKAAGEGSFVLNVEGMSFAPTAVVLWEGSPRPTVFIDSANLTASIPSSDIVIAGTYEVTVDNGGAPSSPANFTVTIPTPQLFNLSPGYASTGGPGFVLSAFGSGFQPNSVVRWNGSDRATTYVNGGELQANITAGDIAANTTAAIDVFTPGGGDSTDINFYVSDIAVNTVNPTSVLVSSGPFTLTVSGSGFQPGDQVIWSGSQTPFSTTYVNANMLTIDIPSSWITFPEAATIAVQSGIVQSNAVPFFVNNPTPALTNLSPDTAPSGTPGLVLTVSGSGFVEGFEGGFAPGPRGLRAFGGTTVSVNGDPRPTTFVDPTTLEISLTGDDLASPGSLAIVANNVGPGGGDTNTLFFTVFELNPSPVVDSLSPPAAVVGATNLQVLVSGSGFVPESVVNWNGSPRATTFLDSATLSVLLLDSDLAAPTVANITVFSPSPGGGTSAPKVFTVATFALTSVSPNPIEVGSGDVTITLTGIGFQPGDAAIIADSGLSTTYVSSTQLTALVPSFFTSFSNSWPVFVTRGFLETNVVFLEIVDPPPVITSLNPPSALVGSPGFTLQVSGENFMEGEGPSSTVYVNGFPRSTTFINEGLLEIDLFSSDLLSPGLIPVQVFNPWDGQFSNIVYFEVSVPIQVNAVMPAKRVAGTGGFTMVIIGNGFEPPDPDPGNENEGILTWNSIPRSFTYISEFEIRVTLLDSDVAIPATHSIVVSNSSGPSQPATFVVVDGVAQPRTGGLHTCARQVTSVVSCWGEGQYGQLGYTPQSSATPPFSPGPQPVPGLTGVTALAAGDYHTCAVTGGLVKCWGLNAVGQLGDGTNADRTVPTTVPGLTNVTAVAAGAFHTCALSVPAGATNGGVSCWGFNGLGQLGAPTTALCGSSFCSTAPLPVTGLESGVVSIVAGGDHSCAVLSSGAMRCWGGNGSGQLGNGSTTNSTLPVNVTGLAGVTAVATGSYHTCAVATGILACWGANGFGQLGAPGGSTCGAPSVAGRSLEIVPAWARGEPGTRAALGSPECALVPVPVTGISNISSVTAGFGHTCATTNAGEAYCWGWNSYGQVGDGTTQPRTTPTLVAGMAGATKTISAGAFHTCAFNTGGGLRCWGDSSYGQVGDGSAVQRNQPSPVQGFAGAPAVTSLSPASVQPGSGAQTVTVNGNGLVPGAIQLLIGGLPGQLPLISVTPTSLVYELPPGSISSPGSAWISLLNTGTGGAESFPLLFSVVPPPPGIPLQVSGTVKVNGETAPNGSVVTLTINGAPHATLPTLVTTIGGQFSFAIPQQAGNPLRSGSTMSLYIDGALAARDVAITGGPVDLLLATSTAIDLVPGATGATWFGATQPPSAFPASVSAVFTWNTAGQRFDFWFRGFPPGFNTLTTVVPGGYYFLQSGAGQTVPMTGGNFVQPQPGGPPLSLVSGTTGAHWTGHPATDLSALPAAVTAVFRWNSTSQQFDFWFRGFPANFQTLTTGLNYGGYYFFQSTQPIQAPMP